VASLLAAINDLDVDDVVAAELDVFKLANPAAGAGFTFTPTQAQAFRPLLLTFLLTASAAVANRVVTLRYQDADGTILGAFAIQTAITANQAARCTFAVDLGTVETASINAFATPIPDLIMPVGWGLAVVVFAEDAADQLSAIVVTGESYWTGKPGESGTVPIATAAPAGT